MLRAPQSIRKWLSLKPVEGIPGESGKRTVRLGVGVFDGLCFLLLLIGFCGGVSVHGRLVLKHAADLRRAVILLSGIVFFFRPHWVAQSHWFRLIQAGAQALGGPRVRRGVILGVMLWAMILAVLQVQVLAVPLYDVGIFHQVLWSLSQGLGFHSSISGAQNFLTDHSSVALALLLPFFQMSGGSVYFLPVIQGVLLWGGAWAWVRLAERLSESDPALASSLPGATVVFILGFESLWRNLRWGFHENAIYFFLLSWALYFYYRSEHVHSLTDELRGGRSPSVWEQPRFLRALVFCLFLGAAAAKEILLLNLALGFLIWCALDGKKRKWTFGELGFFVLRVGAAIALFLGFLAFETMGHPADKNYFNRYYAYLGASLPDFLSNLLASPQKVIETVGLGALLKYGFQV
ncbi:MAG: DUF2079 domain-containing protein, partial [Bdellovibrionia bacterium]